MNLPRRGWEARAIVVALLLVVSAARAQTPPPPPSSPEKPGVTLSEQQVVKKRHSAFSAGPGGPLLIFTETVTGLVLGGAIGGSYVQSGEVGRGVYFGVLTGGLVLGGLASIYQYLVPVGLTTAMLSALGTVVGTLAAQGIYFGPFSPTAAWALALGSQVGAAAPLIATLGVDDVSAGDASVAGSATIYASALMFLGLLLINRNVTIEPMLIAPAVGMGAGGLLAAFTEADAGRVLTLTAVPLGVGFVLFYVGGLAGDIQLAAATSLTGIGIAFALTYLLSSGPGAAATPPRRAARARDRISPTAVVVPVGLGRRQVAVGPGLRGSF
jgi:hypothetical protein